MLVAVKVDVWIAAKFRAIRRRAIFSWIRSLGSGLLPRSRMNQVVKSLNSASEVPSLSALSRSTFFYRMKGTRCFEHL